MLEPVNAAVLEPVAAKVARARLPLTIPFLVQVDPEYLGSLMILVALVLGLGFSILILLALFLCLIITCMQPVNRPSNAMRLVVIAASCSLAISAGLAVTSNRRKEGQAWTTGKNTMQNNDAPSRFIIIIRKLATVFFPWGT